jgi:hypothetical protein
MRSSSRGIRSPLATWVSGEAAVARLRRRLGRGPLVLRPRDREWRRLTPDWRGCLALAGSGLPFHIVAERRYDRSADRRRLGPALERGATVYLPQAHEVLPKVARLMVAIRAQLLGACREECAFLFLVDGQGRDGMGLHHDGSVDAFWVQLAGRRTVTLGPPVHARAPQDLDNDKAERGGPGWRTLDLDPGTLLYLPPFTPHRVLCRGRSLALSLTWKPPRRQRSTSRARAASLASWPIASGQAIAIPRSSDRLWTQVPVVVEGARSGAVLVTPEGRVALPVSAERLSRRLAAMPSLPRSALRGRHRRAVEWLLAQGILDDRDLPTAIQPADPTSLDGWRFA